MTALKPQVSNAKCACHLVKSEADDNFDASCKALLGRPRRHI
jgi:hypothetical protein